MQWRNLILSIMRVKVISADPQKDPLRSAIVIPARLQQHFLPNTERTFFHASKHEYLEQRYVSDDCIMCFLDIDVHEDCTVQPVADMPMLVLLYMLSGSAPSQLFGFGTILLQQGFGYLIYLPSEAIHQSMMSKGHYRVVYCYISQSYLDNMADEHQGIADLLALFTSESPSGFIDKKAPIGYHTLYQIWLVKECGESKAYQESNLKARVLDLVLDYVKESNKKSSTKHFADSVLPKSEKIFQAKMIIDEDQTHKLQIADIARQLQINEQHLKKGFRETIGISIGKYQTNTKIAQACTLLAQTDLPIADIAFLIGYEDKSSLTRMFQKQLKVSPRVYRMNAKKDHEKPN